MPHHFGKISMVLIPNIKLLFTSALGSSGLSPSGKIRWKKNRLTHKRLEKKLGVELPNFSSLSDVYHLVFAPPESEDVVNRLVEEPGGIEENVRRPLDSYHRDTDSLLTCYSRVSKLFNADQPIQDLFDQGIEFFNVALKKSLSPTLAARL